MRKLYLVCSLILRNHNKLQNYIPFGTFAADPLKNAEVYAYMSEKKKHILLLLPFYFL